MSHSSVVGLLNLRLTYPGSQYELGCLRAFFRFSLSAFFRGGGGGYENQVTCATVRQLFVRSATGYTRNVSV